MTKISVWLICGVLGWSGMSAGAWGMYQTGTGKSDGSDKRLLPGAFTTGFETVDRTNQETSVLLDDLSSSTGNSKASTRSYHSDKMTVTIEDEYQHPFREHNDYNDREENDLYTRPVELIINSEKIFELIGTNQNSEEIRELLKEAEEKHKCSILSEQEKNVAANQKLIETQKARAKIMQEQNQQKFYCEEKINNVTFIPEGFNPKAYLPWYAPRNLGFTALKLGTGAACSLVAAGAILYFSPEARNWLAAFSGYTPTSDIDAMEARHNASLDALSQSTFKNMTNLCTQLQNLLPYASRLGERWTQILQNCSGYLPS